MSEQDAGAFVDALDRLGVRDWELWYNRGQFDPRLTGWQVRFWVETGLGYLDFNASQDAVWRRQQLAVIASEGRNPGQI